ncbi:hypothetical protein KP509_19G027200 [Ceratopteris richardii]|uniref:Nephrocystin-3 n=1 Tax=Ceratopteris richardii TaxID=49495 RepID=A0A8T2SJ20_CERRI|nr:hypothetical protein KP509_19G027200 [Ceratopteris richardii]
MWRSRPVSKLLHHERRKRLYLIGDRINHVLISCSSLAEYTSISGSDTAALHAAPTNEDFPYTPSSFFSYDGLGKRPSRLPGSFARFPHIFWNPEAGKGLAACKHRMFCLNPASNGHARRLLVRIESPQAAIFDKDLMGGQKVHPYRETKYLGVHRFGDMTRNYSSFSTAAFESTTQNENSGSSQTSESDKLLKASNVDENLDSSDEDYDSDSEEEVYDQHYRSLPSVSSMIKEESIDALEASLEEMEKAFAPDDVRIGTTCLRLAQLYDSADEEPDIIVAHADRALKILQPFKEGSFDIAMCYHVLGSAYHKMDESEKAIGYLEQAADLLEKVGEAEVNTKTIGTIKYAGQILLGRSRLALDKQEEGLVNFQKALKIHEGILEPGNPDLARSYQEAAEAYIEAEKYEEALRLCLKALPIYENYFGTSSFEVAVLRRLMALIYEDLEEYEKLLNEHEIIRTILLKLGKSKELAALDIASGEALLSLEKYKDAIVKLKEVVKETKETSRFHAHALVLIGKAYTELREGKNAVKHCKKAFNALKDKKTSLDAGSSLMELGSVYHQLNELDQAMAAYKKAFAIFEFHPDQVAAKAEIEGQMGLIYMFMGKVEEGLPYLERSCSECEEIYGTDSEELVPVYNHTGIAYLELGKLEEALQKFEAAKKIAVDCLGPEHGDTVAIYANLANTYAGLERFEEAIECQKHVVEAVRHGKTDYDVTLEAAEEKLKEFTQQAQSAKNA